MVPACRDWKGDQLSDKISGTAVGSGVTKFAERRASNRRLRTLVPLQMRVVVFLGKTLNAISYLGAKQSIRCGGPARRKIYKQNSFCVGVA